MGVSLYEKSHKTSSPECLGKKGGSSEKGDPLFAKKRRIQEGAALVLSGGDPRGSGLKKKNLSRLRGEGGSHT